MAARIVNYGFMNPTRQTTYARSPQSYTIKLNPYAQKIHEKMKDEFENIIQFNLSLYDHIPKEAGERDKNIHKTIQMCNKACESVMTRRSISRLRETTKGTKIVDLADRACNAQTCNVSYRPPLSHRELTYLKNKKGEETASKYIDHLEGQRAAYDDAIINLMNADEIVVSKGNIRIKPSIINKPMPQIDPIKENLVQSKMHTFICQTSRPIHLKWSNQSGTYANARIESAGTGVSRVSADQCVIVTNVPDEKTFERFMCSDPIATLNPRPSEWIQNGCPAKAKLIDTSSIEKNEQFQMEYIRMNAIIQNMAQYPTEFASPVNTIRFDRYFLPIFSQGYTKEALNSQNPKIFDYRLVQTNDPRCSDFYASLKIDSDTKIDRNTITPPQCTLRTKVPVMAYTRKNHK